MWEYNYGYLAHHGIKGQRWGIRRYQNYDGSYTQAGVRRYRESVEKYNAAEERYKKAKASGDPKEISLAKAARARAKNQGNADYRQLKKDLRADKGREKSANGKTILGTRWATSAATGALTLIGSASISAAKNQYASNGSAAAVNVLSAIGGLSYAAAVASGIAGSVTTRQIRSYYAHSRPPRRY